MVSQVTDLRNVMPAVLYVPPNHSSFLRSALHALMNLHTPTRGRSGLVRLQPPLAPRMCVLTIFQAVGYVLQMLGLCLGLAGFGLGLHLGDKGGGQPEYDHKAIGYTVVAGALVQLLFGVARAQKGSSWRLQWAWFHRYCVDTAAVLTCVYHT